MTAEAARISAEVAARAEELSSAQPHDILRYGLQTWGDDMALSFSGAEDVLLIDIASQVSDGFRVFTLDTGRLHPETLTFIEAVRVRYGITIEVCAPQAPAVEELVRTKGLFSFYEDGHGECCGIRKIEPLRRKLSGLSAWATGQRRDQSPTRAEVPVIQLDPAFGSDERPLVKLNPLANWSQAQVWRYIRGANIPFNPLHERGFFSIGCAPCTRPIGPGQHEREGRWWWEEATRRECGLHVASPDVDAADADRGGGE